MPKGDFSILPKSILSLPNNVMNGSSKNLLSVIWALSQKKGHCWAGNTKLAQSTGLSKKTVSNKIVQLLEIEYLQRNYHNGQRLLIPMIEMNGAKIIPIQFKQKLVQSLKTVPEIGKWTPLCREDYSPFREQYSLNREPHIKEDKRLYKIIDKIDVEIWIA